MKLRSLVRVYELDEITSNGGKDWSVTKENPGGSKCKRPGFMQGEPLSWTRGWHRQNSANGGGTKYINTWGPTGAKGWPNRAGMGLGRSAQAGQLGPLQGRSTLLFLHPKILQPKVRGGATIRKTDSHSHREAIHKLEIEVGDHLGKGWLNSKEAPTSGEEGRHCRKRHHDQRWHV
jgi:hypothetical protein